MKHNIFYISFFLIILGLLSFEQKKDTATYRPVDRVSFGVKVGILPTGKLTQYALFFYKDNKVINKEPIGLNKLIKIGQGEWPIPRTNVFTNFFEEEGFENDTLPDGRIVNYISAFDSLWKIRYEAHPFEHSLGAGWSQGEIRPSLKQQAYIYDRYGVRGYDQAYFTDTSFFRLLKDVIDPQWIENYKSLR